MESGFIVDFLDFDPFLNFLDELLFRFFGFSYAWYSRFQGKTSLPSLELGLCMISRSNLSIGRNLHFRSFAVREFPIFASVWLQLIQYLKFKYKAII